MNIEDLPQKAIEFSSLKQTREKKTLQKDTPAAASKSEVKVNMSRLTRMMSDNMNNLREMHDVRPDKIAAYRKTMDDNVEISDSQIDSILRRMIIA